jgi:hypothetical protein
MDETYYDRCDNGHIDVDSVHDSITGDPKCLVINGNPASFSGYCHAIVRAVPIDQAWYDAQEQDDSDLGAYAGDAFGRG